MTTITPADGPTLEAEWTSPSDRAAGAIVFCHPHPQHGGTMRAPLMKTVSTLLARAGFAVLRFNFRGVGASEGAWGGGRAEVADVAAAIEAASAAHPTLPLGVAGWSFGSGAALNWQASSGSTIPYVGIAPAVRVEGITMPESTSLAPAPRLLIVGDRDQFTTVEDLATYAAAIGARLEVMAGSDHFFLFRHDRLAGLVADHFSAAFGVS